MRTTKGIIWQWRTIFPPRPKEPFAPSFPPPHSTLYARTDISRTVAVRPPHPWAGNFEDFTRAVPCFFMVAPLFRRGLWQSVVCGFWMYIVKHFAFHQAFPMVSLSYVMGMLAAVFIFHEEVPFTRWIGLAFILVGVALISK